MSHRYRVTPSLLVWLKKFMQVEVDKLCMCTNFGGRGPSSFGDIVTFKNGQISLLDQSMVIKKINGSKSAQKIYASGC